MRDSGPPLSSRVLTVTGFGLSGIDSKKGWIALLSHQSHMHFKAIPNQASFGRSTSLLSCAHPTLDSKAPRTIALFARPLTKAPKSFCDANLTISLSPAQMKRLLKASTTRLVNGYNCLLKAGRLQVPWPY